jgi:hypothetical protein
MVNDGAVTLMSIKWIVTSRTRKSAPNLVRAPKSLEIPSLYGQAPLMIIPIAIIITTTEI